MTYNTHSTHKTKEMKKKYKRLENPKETTSKCEEKIKKIKSVNYNERVARHQGQTETVHVINNRSVSSVFIVNCFQKSTNKLSLVYQ